MPIYEGEGVGGEGEQVHCGRTRNNHKIEAFLVYTKLYIHKHLHARIPHIQRWP